MLRQLSKGRAAKSMPLDFEILGYGKGSANERFVKLESMIDGEKQSVLLSCENLSQDIQRYKRLGAPLYDDVAMRLLEKMIIAQAQEPTFEVATQNGWARQDFVLYDTVISVSNIEDRTAVYLGPSVSKFATKFEGGGGIAGWAKSSSMSRFALGNPKLMLALTVPLCGPCARIFDCLPPAVHFRGGYGAGQSELCLASGSIWGRHLDPIVGKARGISEVVTLASKGPELLAAHNDTALILQPLQDHGATPEKQVAAMNEISGARTSGASECLIDGTVETYSWRVPIIFWSAEPVDPMRRDTVTLIEQASRSRTILMPPSSTGTGFFDDLHDFPNAERAREFLAETATSVYGRAGIGFVRQACVEMAAHAKALKKWFAVKKREYMARTEFAAHLLQLAAPREDLSTIYATGCLAIRFETFPWTEQELLGALLVCFRDHMAFAAASGAAASLETKPLQRLLNHIRETSHAFLVLGKDAPPERPCAAEAPGFRWTRNGEELFGFSDKKFSSIAGGSVAAVELKNQLEAMGLVIVTGQGKRRKFVTKAPKLDGTRMLCVAVKAKILGLP